MSNYQHPFYQATLNQIETEELERVEDKIPYLCEFDDLNWFSCVFEQNDTGGNYLHTEGPHGYHLSKCKTATKYDSEHSSPFLDQLSHCNYAEKNSVDESHLAYEKMALPAPRQRSNENQTAPLQGSFTVHHKGQSSIVRKEDFQIERKITLNQYQSVPGMYHADLFHISAERCQ